MEITFTIANKWGLRRLFIDHCNEAAIDVETNKRAMVKIENDRLTFKTCWSGFEYVINLNQIETLQRIKVTYKGARKGFLKQNLLFDCEEVEIQSWICAIARGTWDLSYYDDVVRPKYEQAKQKFTKLGFDSNTVNKLVAQLDTESMAMWLEE